MLFWVVSSILAIGHHVWVIVRNITWWSKVSRNAKSWRNTSGVVCLIAWAVTCSSEVVSLSYLWIASIKLIWAISPRHICNIVHIWETALANDRRSILGLVVVQTRNLLTIEVGDIAIGCVVPKNRRLCFLRVRERVLQKLRLGASMLIILDVLVSTSPRLVVIRVRIAWTLNYRFSIALSHLLICVYSRLRLGLQDSALRWRDLVEANHCLSREGVWTSDRRILIIHQVLRGDYLELRRHVLALTRVRIPLSVLLWLLGEVSQIHLALSSRRGRSIFSTHHDHWIKVVSVVHNIPWIIGVLAVLILKGWNWRVLLMMSFWLLLIVTMRHYVMAWVAIILVLFEVFLKVEVGVIGLII